MSARAIFCSVILFVSCAPRFSQAAKTDSSANLITIAMDDIGVGAMSSAIAKLRSMRAAFESGKYDDCLTQAPAAKKLAKSLENWILSLELQCAARLSPSKASSERLVKVLAGADLKTSAMSFGPWAIELRQSWGRARLASIEMDLKFNRARSWQNIEKLSAAASTALDDNGRAKLWRIAGELLFLQQKMEASREFFRRSLAEIDQPELRDRIRAIDSQLPAEPSRGGLVASAAAPPVTTSKSPEGTVSEIDLYDRISSLIKSGDLVAAAEDAIKLMREYPGSTRAKWAADRTIESLISVGEKSSDKASDRAEKLIPVRESLLKLMEKADADRLADWSRTAFNKGLWPEAARLSKAAAAGLQASGASRATKTLEITLDALYAVDDFKGARQVAEELVEKHSGTASARLAMFRLGLMAYRESDFARAASLFERLLASPQIDNLELSTRYWLWRSLLKSKSERATAAADELMRKYAFSYYGLRARLETNGGKIEWTKETPKFETRLWVTGEEKLAWERALALISSGWFEAAQEELKTLPAPSSPEGKAIRAKVWASAKQFLNASKLANEAWDAKFDLRRLDLMRVAWPDEYKVLFETAAKAKSLDPFLTRSLAKQESGYNPKAVSVSNALGLMQMIPPTAKEIADDLKIPKLFLPDDMFDPARNIPMGTHYIAKMINFFKGHVPLALAAYNAGPTRLDRWVKSRPSLAGLEATRSSAPEYEIWIDEFPYAETSFYVKAILRNLLLYRLIEEGVVTTQEPLWKSPSTAPRP